MHFRIHYAIKRIFPMIYEYKTLSERDFEVDRTSRKFDVIRWNFQVDHNREIERLRQVSHINPDWYKLIERIPYNFY